MAVAKVILNSVTQMDITSDTVAAANLLSGYTAHGADGNLVSGEYAPVLDTYTATLTGSNWNSLYYVEHNQNIYSSIGASFSFYPGDVINIYASYTTTHGIYINTRSVVTATWPVYSLVYSAGSISASVTLFARNIDIERVNNDIVVHLNKEYASDICGVADDWATGTFNGPVSLPNATYIRSHAFREAYGLTSIYAPRVSQIRESAFYNCRALNYVEMPALSDMSSYAFWHCEQLTSVSFPKLSRVLIWGFAYCYNLSDLYMPNVGWIWAYAFAGCSSLTTINVIGSNNSSIVTDGGWQFSGCVGLTEVVTSKFSYITWGMFNGCNNLSLISIDKASYISSSAFSGLASGIGNRTLYFPSVYCLQGSAIFLNTYGISRITSYEFPLLSDIWSYALTSIPDLEYVDLPICSHLTYAYILMGNEKLSTIKLLSLSSVIGTTFASISYTNTFILSNCSLFSGIGFKGNYNLLSLYLLGSSICKLSNASFFSSTPISNYTTSTGGVYGSVFVAESLYAGYVSSTNWTTYSARLSSLTDAQIQNVLLYGTHEPQV